MTDAVTTDAGRRARVPLGPAFTRLWVSSALSNAGDGIVRALLPLLVVVGHPERGAGPVAAVAALNALPWLLLSLPVGALVDRVDRRRALLAGNLMRAVTLLAAIAVLRADAPIWWLGVLAFLLGSAETVVDTAAPATLPALVPPEALERANARLFVPQIVLNDMVGPPLAGLLVGVSATLALLGGGSLYLLAAAALLGLHLVTRDHPAHDDPAHERRSTSAARQVLHDIAEGVGFVLRDRVLRLTLACSGLFSLTFSATFAVLVVQTRDRLGLGPVGYGVLLTVASLGSLLGSQLAGVLAGGRWAALVTRWSLPVTALTYVVVGVSRSTVLTGAALGVGAVATMCWNIPVLAVRQRRAPATMQGRVMSFTRLLSWGLMPVGAAVGGLLGDLATVPMVFYVAGAALLVGSVPLLAWLKPTDLS